MKTYYVRKADCFWYVVKHTPLTECVVSKLGSSKWAAAVAMAQAAYLNQLAAGA